MNNSVIVSLRDIVVEFDGQRILDGLNLDIHDKEFVTLLGSSGCGKTTTLRLIAGFLEPTSGKVLLKGEDITGVPPYKRPVNTVFQKYALFPHLNVFENVAFGLRLKKMDEETIRRKVRDMLEVVGLKGFERRSIGQMSGGQQQRVAIARTLAPGPKVLFMDEPLSNLDAKLRMEMRTELKRLHRDTDSTFVYVTHDQLEAMTLSTRVCIMQNGLLQQYAPPLEMYNNPANLFVADFMGNPTMNFIDGTAEVNGATAQLTFGSLHGAFTAKEPISLTGKDVVVGIRPEYIRISDEGARHANVYSTLPAGMETTVKLDVEGTMLTAVVFGDVDYPVDCPVKFDFSKTAILFDKATGKNIACGTLELK